MLSLRTRHFGIVVVALLVYAASAEAGPLKKLRRHFVRPVPSPIVAAVRLQPFILDAPLAERAVYEPAAIPVSRAEAIQVAYYTPRAQPVYVPQNQDADDDEDLPERPAPVTEVGTANRGPIVPGDRAILRNGIAYAPAYAPDRVKRAIWAVNSLRDKPYIWGGGHGSFYDRGYDCSGAVSYALHYAGALNFPLPSNELRSFGRWGRGRWITVYARNGHTFAIIAGLRLDTTDLRDGGDVGPRWYAWARDTRGFTARHPDGL